jgi:hypothetical protein
LTSVRAVTAHAIGLWTCFHLGACDRHADIYDEPDVLVLGPTREPDAGEIPELDAGLGTDAFAACSERTVGKCEGPVDFGCRFSPWVDNTAIRCQAATGCKTNGWLYVKLDSQGCVGTIGMDHPNDAIVKCLADEFTTTRCTCTDIEKKYYFGLANTGSEGGSVCAGPKGVP